MYLFSAQNTIHKTKLLNTGIWIMLFWYSMFGCLASLAVSAIFEKMTLPSSPRDWGFLIGHCFGGAVFVITITIAQQIASLITVSLSLGFHILWYFIAQYVFFYESTTEIGLAIEVSGATLVVVSSILDPLDKIKSQSTCCKTNP